MPEGVRLKSMLAENYYSITIVQIKARFIMKKINIFEAIVLTLGLEPLFDSLSLFNKLDVQYSRLFRGITTLLFYRWLKYNGFACIKYLNSIYHIISLFSHDFRHSQNNLLIIRLPNSPYVREYPRLCSIGIGPLQ